MRHKISRISNPKDGRFYLTSRRNTASSSQELPSRTISPNCGLFCIFWCLRSLIRLMISTSGSIFPSKKHCRKTSPSVRKSSRNFTQFWDHFSYDAWKKTSKPNCQKKLSRLCAARWAEGRNTYTMKWSGMRTKDLSQTSQRGWWTCWWGWRRSATTPTCSNPE